MGRRSQSNPDKTLLSENISQTVSMKFVDEVCGNSGKMIKSSS